MLTQSRKIPSNQKGMALVISLVLLLALTLMVAGSMRGSLFQEKMTANQFNQSRALMAAEAGAAEVWNWLVLQEESGQMNWADATWQSSLQTNFNTAIAVAASKGRFTVEQIDWGNPSKVSITLLGEAIDASPEPFAVASARVEVEFLRPITSGGSPAPAFLAGFLSDGDITINGKSSFEGSIHTNSNFSNKSGGSTLGASDSNYTISAVNNAAFNGSLSKNAKVVSKAPKITVPRATDFISQNRVGSNVVQSCNIPSGDLQGKYYYCNGNATVSGAITNGTVMASGNITSSGGVNLGNNKINVALIATGNIVFNGSRDSFGLFWSDGSLTQNGSSLLGGSIVSKGAVTYNGAFNYRQVKDFDENLEDIVEASNPQKLRIARWAERR